MRKVCFLSFVVLFAFGCDSATSQTARNPSKWIGSAPFFFGGEKGTFDDEGVKDPTIVKYKGKWHLFYTISRKEPGGIGYASGKTLEAIDNGPRYWLKQFSGKTSDSKGGAPQVFYFEPQKLWYLIYQTKDFNRQPVYSTTPTIDKPDSWTETRNLVPREEPDVKWIDFWVMCDETKAYFFYSRGRKDVYVRTTKIEDFPNGFGPGQLAFSPMPEPLTEAVHIYKVKGKKEYHMLYETSPGRDQRRRYGLATASDLLGPWVRVADDYAIGTKMEFPNIARWTDDISHGEMIRTGYDQRLEYDPDDCQFLIQGISKKDDAPKPDRAGWRLGIIRPSYSK